MSFLRRFAQREQANVEGTPTPEPETAAIENVQEVKSDEQVEPDSVDAIPEAENEPELSAPARSAAESVLNRLKSRTRAPRAVSETALLLKSMGPLLRAGLMYPGPGATPEQYGDVVERLSLASLKLTKMVANEIDPLELDNRWALQSLVELSSELVANHWVATVISRGGAGSEDDPIQAVELLSAAIRKVVHLPIDLSGRRDAFDLSYEGAVRLSFLKAFAPMSVDIDKYGRIVNGRLESEVVDTDALQGVFGQLLMDQSLIAQEQLLIDSSGTDDDRRMTFQSCLGHVGAIFLATWELTRGDALGTLADAPSIEDGRRALNGPAFAYGFPVDSFRDRSIEAVQRLVGTTQAAMSMIRQKNADPTQRRGD